MKKSMLEFGILLLAFCMMAVIGMVPQGFGLALIAVGLELVFGILLCRLYALLEREERRIARRARQDARAHHAAQMYRAGVRLGTVNTAVNTSSTRPAPDLRVA